MDKPPNDKQMRPGKKAGPKPQLKAKKGRKGKAVKALKAVVVLVLVSALAGCSLFHVATPSTQSDPAMPGGLPAMPTAPAEDGFPWDWLFGLAIVAAIGAGGAILLKQPSLIDYVLVAAGAMLGIVIVTEISERVWSAKWAITLMAAIIGALLTLWKLGRRWLAPKPAATAGPDAGP